MIYLEKRRSQRTDVSQIISYYLLDENEKILSAGVADTINISDVGLLIATSKMIQSQYILIVIRDGRNKVLEMKGKVSHSRRDQSGQIYTGIEFIGDDSQKKQFTKHFKKLRRY